MDILFYFAVSILVFLPIVFILFQSYSRVNEDDKDN